MLQYYYKKIFYETDIISVRSIKDLFNGCIKFNFLLLKKQIIANSFLGAMQSSEKNV